MSDRRPCPRPTGCPPAGEPTVRFWELLDYATAHDVGVKFSTNGIKIDVEAARRIAANSYVDIQISVDGATAEVNDAVRGAGSYDVAVRALQHLSDVGVSAKLCPDTIEQAAGHAEEGLDRIGSDTDLCFAFLKHCGLKL